MTVLSTRADAACTAPPTDFKGAVSFDDTCSFSYCPPSNGETLLSPDGPVTRQEFESALFWMIASTPVTTIAKQGNTLAYRHSAKAAYGSGLLYQMSSDRRALDVMVRYADNVMFFTNKNVTLWTGNIEPIWSDPVADATTSAGWPTCEHGAIAAHIANAALAIFRTPCVHSLVPPEFPGYPTPFSATMTYLERAQEYLKAAEAAFDAYFFPHFLDPNGLLIQSNDPRWNPGHLDVVFPPGSSMPWNRRMMVLHGLVRVAQAEEHLPQPNATRIAHVDQLIKVNIDDFLHNTTDTVSKTGSPTKFWKYNYNLTDHDQAEEAFSLHGQYDVFGLFFSWQRTPSLASDEVMTRFVNTFQDTIYQKDTGLFSGYVDGTSLTPAPGITKGVPTPALSGAEWAYYAKWRPEWFNTMLNSRAFNNFSDPSRIMLIWIKHGLHTDTSDVFWRGGMPHEAKTGKAISTTGDVVPPAQMKAKRAFPAAGPASLLFEESPANLGVSMVWNTLAVAIVLLAVVFGMVYIKEKKNKSKKLATVKLDGVLVQEL